MFNNDNSLICPFCGASGLENTSEGLLCSVCGKITHSNPTGSSPLSKNQPDLPRPEAEDNQFLPIPLHQSTNISSDTLVNNTTQQAVPKIINHRASSYYRQRLLQRNQELNRPEIAAPEVSKPLVPETNRLLTSHTMAEKYIPDQIKIDNSLVPTNSSASNNSTNLTPAEQQLLEAARMQSGGPSISNQLLADKSHLRKSPDAKVEALIAAASSNVNNNSSSLKNWLMIGTAVLLVLVSGYVLLQDFQPRKSNLNSVRASLTPVANKSSPASVQTTAGSKRDSQRKSDLNSIAIGLEAYKKSTGSYPAGESISALIPLTKTNPPFISELQNDPLTKDNPNAATVNYGYSSDGTKFSLTAVLENKQDTDSYDGLYIVHSQR